MTSGGCLEVWLIAPCTAPSTTLAVIEGLGTRLQHCSRAWTWPRSQALMHDWEWDQTFPPVDSSIIATSS